MEFYENIIFRPADGFQTTAERFLAVNTLTTAGFQRIFFELLVLRVPKSASSNFGIIVLQLISILCLCSFYWPAEGF